MTATPHTTLTSAREAAVRRHVYYYTHLPASTARPEETLAGDPSAWLPPPAERSDDAPDQWLVELHAEGAVPDAVAAQTTRVTVDAARTGADWIVRPVRWQGDRLERLFPVLSGEVVLAALPEHGWHLSLIGEYQAPLSVVGEAADRLYGHRIAEAAVRRFVLAIAERLASVPAGER